MDAPQVLYILRWLIRDTFRRNLPYDQFVRAIVTARCSTFEQGPATIFRDRREPEEIAPMVSQLFLGIRLECAKCHHHPFESWGQEQFYEFAAFFARVGRKGVVHGAHRARRAAQTTRYWRPSSSSQTASR